VLVSGFARLDLPASDALANDEIDMVVTSAETSPVRWRFANAEYNERNRELTVANSPVALEAKPLEVLLCLLRAEGELVTKQELFDTVWAGRVVTDGVLSQSIRRIREVLGDTDRSMLRTVHGYGFRLDVPIEIEGRDDPGTQLQLEAGQLLPNLPNWVLDQRLQTRPSNELWRIRHVQSGQFRVVKLALDERARRALMREVTLNKVLRAELGDEAPLVPLLEWQFETSPAWIQMPWYEMGSLSDWLLSIGGPRALKLPDRLRIVAEAAEALAKAHALGVMHKDIKPGNLMVEHHAGEARLLMCDFGSGTVKSRERLEQSGVTVMGFTKSVQIDSTTSGTPAYMAPEVLRGGVFSEQSDVFALGVLLYQLVIGDLNQPMAPGWEEDVTDGGLREIIAEACAGKPARRIVDMASLAQRIRAWAPGQGADAGPPGVTTQSRRRPLSRHRRLGVALVIVALLAVFWLWRHTEVIIIATDDAPAASPQTASDDQRVAILAFDLLGLDRQTQTVMGGLQDALIADLANLSGIRLVHGQNLSRLGLVDAPARQIGRALKADQLIRGSVQQSGERLRVNLQIVDAARDEATWGKAIQGTRADLFSVQADIARALATALGTNHAPPSGQSVNNQAYEAYLAALSLWNEGGVQVEALTAEIERALVLDPDFIDAHLLALLKAARDYWSSASPRAESESRIALHLAALERLDTSPVKLATARAVWRYYLEHDPAGGLEILAPFRRQLVRNTESALFYAYMLRRVGRVDEAYSILDQVMDQDPSAIVPLETKAEMLALQGKGGEAITLLQQVVDLSPERSMTKIQMASYSYTLTGELGFLQRGREFLTQSEHYKDMTYFADLEIARRKGDLVAIRELARTFDSEDKTSSGHGREPWELGVAWALYVGQAPLEEVHALARVALEKIQLWRGESDSASRRSTMAQVLALLGRTQEAIALSAQVEAEYPFERDELEAAAYLLKSATIYAFVGDEKGVLERLEKLAASTSFRMNLCMIPYEIAYQGIWQIPAAQAFVQQQCDAVWAHNRRELPALIAEL